MCQLAYYATLDHPLEAYVNSIWPEVYGANVILSDKHNDLAILKLKDSGIISVQVIVKRIN